MGEVSYLKMKKVVDKPKNLVNEDTEAKG